MTWVMPQLEMFHFSAGSSRPLQIAADNFTSTYNEESLTFQTGF